MLTAHAEAIEADLLEHFHVDLRRLGAPELTYRRLRSLLSQLPRASRYMRAMVGDDHTRWGETERILADLVDAVNAASYRAVKMAHGITAKPKPYPRPWDRKPETTVLGNGPGMTVAEYQEFMRRPRVDKPAPGR